VEVLLYRLTFYLEVAMPTHKCQTYYDDDFIQDFSRSSISKRSYVKFNISCRKDKHYHSITQSLPNEESNSCFSSSTKDTS